MGSEDATTWSIPPPPALTAAAASQIVLVGREDEWGQLRAAWERARGRSPPARARSRRARYWKNAPGDGVRAFRRAEATVLLGRCDQEALVPQQPFVEALEWYARECPPEVLEAQLADVDGVRELAQLIAPIARRVRHGGRAGRIQPRRPAVPPVRSSGDLVSEVARATPAARGARGSALGGQAYAAAPATSAAVVARGAAVPRRHLSRKRRRPNATRSPRCWPNCAARRGVTRVGLQGLGRRTCTAVHRAMDRTRESAFADTPVAGNTEGNPFFIGEVLRHFKETGALAREETSDRRPGARRFGGLPEGVREAIAGACRRLSDGCNRVLSLASVVGREFKIPVLTGARRDIRRTSCSTSSTRPWRRDSCRACPEHRIAMRSPTHSCERRCMES